MSAKQQIEELLKDVSTHEKAELAQRLYDEVSDAFPGIRITPGVCGGKPCVGNHRIPVYGLVEHKRLGWDDATILQQFPTLTQQDLDNAWEYARTHRDE